MKMVIFCIVTSCDISMKYVCIYELNILGASEITANLCCNCVYLYWEGCVICSIYLRLYMERYITDNSNDRDWKPAYI